MQSFISSLHLFIRLFLSFHLLATVTATTRDLIASYCLIKVPFVHADTPQKIQGVLPQS